MISVKTWIVGSEAKDCRLDQYLMEKEKVSRSRVQKWMEDGLITVSGKARKNSYRLKENDCIEVEEEILVIEDIQPENIPLDIVYEDEDVIVVNKANKMVVHPALGHTSGTLVNALLYHFDALSQVNGVTRPGIVHRIDAETTGLLVVAKTNEAHVALAKQLEEKKTHRKYIALVWGIIKHDTGTIDAPIGRDINDRKKMAVVADGKPSVTHFRVLERYSQATLIELQLETGRTHQIRVHMNYIGYPVVNDPVYGRRKVIDDSGQCLHAKELGFIHPRTQKYMEFTSELPDCFQHILEQFKN